MTLRGYSLGLFGFALAAAYVPWITGAASTPRWAVLVVGCIGVLALTKPRWCRITPAGCFGVLFLAWAAVSMWLAPAPEAFDQVWKLALYAMLFMAGGRLSTLRPFYAGAALGIGISSVVCMLDVAGLIAMAQVSKPSGLFVNGIYLAEFTAMVLVGLLGHGMIWWVWPCLPSLLLVMMPRGAFLALAFAGYCEVLVRRRSVAVPIGLLLVALVPMLIWLRPDTVVERIDTWRDVAANLTFLGHGLGAYFGDAPLISVLVDASINRKLHANNDWLELAYDLGAPGVILGAGFVAAILLYGEGWPEKLVVIVFLVEACFGFPVHLPWSAGLFFLVAGHLAGGGERGLRAAGTGRDSICAGHGGAGGTGLV